MIENRRYIWWTNELGIQISLLDYWFNSINYISNQCLLVKWNKKYMHYNRLFCCLHHQYNINNKMFYFRISPLPCLQHDRTPFRETCDSVFLSLGSWNKIIEVWISWLILILLFWYNFVNYRFLFLTKKIIKSSSKSITILLRKI